MDGQKKKNNLFNENVIRVNDELFNEYTTLRENCADADEEKSLLSEYTGYFIYLNRVRIERILLYLSVIGNQEDFPFEDSTTWKDVKTRLVIPKEKETKKPHKHDKSEKSDKQYGSMTICEDLYETFVDKEVSHLISIYEKKYNKDGTEIPFLSGMCGCLKKKKIPILEHSSILRNCKII